ncbi:MAG: PfkB family carbohydrate kinase [Armatimonadota bacterium]
MDSLSHILERFGQLRALVVGDLMVDEHIWGTTSRVSPEAPVLVVDANGDSEVLPGGAANVANNIRALGGSVAVVGVVGNDPYGEELAKKLSNAGVDTSGLVVDQSRVTTRKTRIWVSHRQQVVRVDRETQDPVDEAVIEEILENIREKLKDCDVLVLSDYNKGVLKPEVASRVVALASGMGKICTANAKPVNIRGFQGARLVALNQSEAETVAGLKFKDEEIIKASGRSMLSELSLDCLVVTRGSVGLTIFSKDFDATLPAVPIEVYDVTGAGDTVISAISLALAAGASPVAAAKIGNLAGGAAVRKVGVAAVTCGEIRALANTKDE